jgi:hypothetical protein
MSKKKAAAGENSAQRNMQNFSHATSPVSNAAKLCLWIAPG